MGGKSLIALFLAALALVGVAQAVDMTSLNSQILGVTGAAGASLKVSFIQMADGIPQGDGSAPPASFDIAVAGSAPAPSDVNDNIATAVSLLASSPDGGPAYCFFTNITSAAITAGTAAGSKKVSLSIRCTVPGMPVASATFAANGAPASGVCVNIPATSMTLPTFTFNYVAIWLPDDTSMTFNMNGSPVASGVSLVELAPVVRPAAWSAVPPPVPSNTLGTYLTAAKTDGGVEAMMSAYTEELRTTPIEYMVTMHLSYAPCMAAGAKTLPPVFFEGEGTNVASFKWNGMFASSVVALTGDGAVPAPSP